MRPGNNQRKCSVGREDPQAGCPSGLTGRAIRASGVCAGRTHKSAQEIIAGMETILTIERVESLRWMNLPESEDLATPTIEVNRVVEEWLE